MYCGLVVHDVPFELLSGDSVADIKRDIVVFTNIVLYLLRDPPEETGGWAWENDWAGETVMLLLVAFTSTYYINGWSGQPDSVKCLKQILSGDLVNVSLSYEEFIYLVVCFWLHLQVKKLKAQLEQKTQKNGTESNSSPDGEILENGTDPNIIELQSAFPYEWKRTRSCISLLFSTNMCLFWIFSRRL